MLQFALFFGENYYSEGGWEDFQGTFADQVRDQVWDQFQRQVWGQVHRQVRDQVRDKAK